MLVTIIDKSQRTSVISLRLCIVNLRSGGQQHYKVARLSKAKLWDILAADG
jgi:hypothetical protein